MGTISVNLSRREPIPTSETAMTEDQGRRFFIYEHYGYDLVRLHQGSCRFCKNGAGLKGRGSTNTGQWLPADNLAAAIELARTIGRLDTAACSWCLPGQRVEMD
jgi:hypothetical protein